MKDPVYAFPSENDSEKTYNWINKGMTLRDYFAAAALAGGLDQDANGYWHHPGVIAKRAYEIADAMMMIAREAA